MIRYMFLVWTILSPIFLFAQSTPNRVNSNINSKDVLNIKTVRSTNWDPNSIETILLVDRNNYGIYKVDPLDKTSKDDSVMVIVTKNQLRLKRIVNQSVNILWFGAIADSDTTNGTGTDNSSAIQKAINYVNNHGGGEVFIPKGTFGINSPLYLKANVSLKGESMFNSIIYALKDNFTLIDRDNNSTNQNFKNAYVSVSSLCLWGYGDRNRKQNPPNGNPCYLLRLGSIKYINVDNVFGRDSREMAIALRGDEATVKDCILERILRDGINVADCKRVIITNNRGKWIEDDFISVDAGTGLPNDTKTNVNEPSIISGNLSFNSQGIIVMGARNAIISNNNLTLVKGRGIRIGFENNYAFVENMNVLIVNNVIRDMVSILPTKELDYDGKLRMSGSVNGIEIKCVPSQTFIQGIKQNNIDNLQKSHNIYKVKPELSWNQYGTKAPKSWSNGIIIANNSLIQSLGGLSKFSDGYGEGLWIRTGLKDIDSWNGTIYYSNGKNQEKAIDFKTIGISISGSIQNLIISQNNIYGFRQGVWLDKNPNKINFIINDNIFSRLRTGISFDADSTLLLYEVSIHDNTFDIDPYREALDRNTNGTWNNIEKPGYEAITGLNISGVKVYNNTFKNTKTPIYSNNKSNILFNSNYIYSDFYTGSGIAKVDNMLDNNLMQINLSEDSKSYGAIIKYGVRNSLQQPKEGFYIKGDFVRNTNILNLDADKYLSGWLRLTTGENHTNADWKPIFYMSK